MDRFERDCPNNIMIKVGPRTRAIFWYIILAMIILAVRLVFF